MSSSEDTHRHAPRLDEAPVGFIPSPSAAQTLRGHPFLLVDDVMTTEATLQVATSCLPRAGAGEILALTIAPFI